MTTFTTITNGEIDADSPVTTTLMQAYRDNIPATAEGAANAPVVAAGWHPYDMVLVGDGNDGSIYSGSTVSTITTPDFEDGYEYMLVFKAVIFGAVDLRCQMYKETDAAYTGNTSSANIANGTGSIATYGALRIVFPRTLSIVHDAVWEQRMIEATGLADIAVAGAMSATDATVQPILRARLALQSGNFTGGDIYMLRRREYMTG